MKLDGASQRAEELDREVQDCQRRYVEHCLCFERSPITFDCVPYLSMLALD